MFCFGKHLCLLYIQIDRIEVMVPDPLEVIKRQIPNLQFSLAFWRSTKAFEDLGDTRDVLLTLIYKLLVTPGKGEFLWVGKASTGLQLLHCCLGESLK